MISEELSWLLSHQAQNPSAHKDPNRDPNIIPAKPP
jgi:hypothetical protein